MNKKIFAAMSRANGALCCLIPLYPEYTETTLDCVGGQWISLTTRPNNPLAYVIDVDQDPCSVVSAEFAERNIEILGEL